MPQIDDKVRIKKPGCCGAPGYIKEGTVKFINDDPTTLPYLVVPVNRLWGWYHSQDCLEVIK